MKEGTKVAFTDHEGRHVGVVESVMPSGSVLIRYRRGSSEWTLFRRPDTLEVLE